MLYAAGRPCTQVRWLTTITSQEFLLFGPPLTVVTGGTFFRFHFQRDTIDRHDFQSRRRR